MVLAFAEPSKATCKQNCKLKSEEKDWSWLKCTGKKEEITFMTPILFQAAAVANGCRPGKQVMFGSILASQRMRAPSTLLVRLTACKAVPPNPSFALMLARADKRSSTTSLLCTALARDSTEILGARRKASDFALDFSLVALSWTFALLFNRALTKTASPLHGSIA